MTFEKIEVNAVRASYNAGYEKAVVARHAKNIKEQMKELQKKIDFMDAINSQTVEDFTFINGMKEVEDWTDISQYADDYQTNQETKFYEITTDGGTFHMILDHQGSSEKAMINVFQMDVPNATPVQERAIYDIVVSNLAQQIIVLSEHYSIEDYFREREISVECINDTTDKTYGYYQSRTENLKLNQVYQGHRIFGNALIDINGETYTFENKDISKHFVFLNN